MDGGQERIGLVRASRGRGEQLVHGACKIWRFQCILDYRVIVAVYLGEVIAQGRSNEVGTKRRRTLLRGGEHHEERATFW